MSEERREQLLGEVFRRSQPAPAMPGGLDPALVSKIVTGLVFAQRPITSASQSLNQQYDLGRRGAHILSLISNGVQYPNDLATLLRIGRSLVTAELTRLTDAGLIESTSGDDRRRTQLSLTALGRDINARFRAAIVATIESRLDGFTPEQVELFAAMLLRMQDEREG